MNVTKSHSAENGAAKVDLRGSGFDGTSLPPIVVEFDAEHEDRLRAWAEGWDACRASLQPQLDRANADADRYYRLAFDTPQDLRARLDETARGHWADFLRGGAL